MDISAKAEQIISQADQWTFAGDCALLQLIKDIGKNLEERANATNKNFDEFSSNLKQTGLALDNVTNSLAALQYTQFVENRCHDDDETVAAVSDVPLDIGNQHDESKNSDGLWKIILNKNLEVLRNCHERYSLDLEDSDGEEEDTTNNFIYQPKNPYNERLLPHIYGTKLWNENWHVGLCDDSNSYSGDEISEAFSESSSSPAEDNLSFESNSANLAEWASTTTANMKHQKQPIRIQNASSLSGSQSIFPPVQENLSGSVAIPINAPSSAISGLGGVNIKQNDPHFDMFVPVRESPPPASLSSSSSASSLQHQRFKNQSVIEPNNDDRRDSEAFVRKADIANTSSNSIYAPPIKRRPVNLFDDDDFSSFLTEIADKSASREPAITNNGTISKAVSTENHKEPEPFRKQNAQHTQPLEISVQQNKKSATINLFDSPDSSPKKKDLFAVTKEIVVTKKEESVERPKLNTKTLFDDDDEDDFMTLFSSKKRDVAKPIASRLNLFDDNDDDDEFKILPSLETGTRQSIEESMKAPGPQEKNDLLTSPGNDQENIQSNHIITENRAPAIEPTFNQKKIGDHEKENLFSKKKQQNVDIFSDIDVAKDNGGSESGTPAFQQKTDLFSSEDDDDLFQSTFESARKENAQIPVENMGDVEQNIPTIIQGTQENFKENTETFETNVNKKQGDKDANVFHGGSEGSMDTRQNEIVQSKKEIEEANVEVIRSYQEEENDKIPNVHSDNFLQKEKQIKNTYADLFLNEPPDDDDNNSAFFETPDSNVLSGSGFASQQFDHDIFEPALPAPPTGDLSTTVKTNPTSSYSNLGLFSDVPPDDDDIEDLSANSKNISSRNETKRIHSIFYDDFTETMEALNSRKSKENNSTLHSIFSDEPPPDDDFETFLRNPTKFSEAKIDAMKENIDKPEEKKSPKSIPVSKLKIPNININVQALLPGATQKPQFRKSLESGKQNESISTVEKLETSSSTALSTQTEIKRDSAENILVNVCKHRVRAPARRRPSTRQGRQENYRKSLANEQEVELHKDDEKQQANLIEQQHKERVCKSPEKALDVTKDNTGIYGEAQFTDSSAVFLPPKSLEESDLSTASPKYTSDLLYEDKSDNNKMEPELKLNEPKSNSLFNAEGEENDDSDFLFGSGDMKTIKGGRNAEVGNSGLKKTYVPFYDTNTEKISHNTIKDERQETVADKILKETNEPTSSQGANELLKSLEGYTVAESESTVRKTCVSGGLFDAEDEDDFIFPNKKDNTIRVFENSSAIHSQSPKLIRNESEFAKNKQTNMQNDSSSIKTAPFMSTLKDSLEPEKLSNKTEKTSGNEAVKPRSNTNIFGDEDDDDDDSLFGNNASKTKAPVIKKTTISSIAADKTEPKSLSLKKDIVEQPNKSVTPAKVTSLFDSDDDDDIVQNNGTFSNAFKKPSQLTTRLTKAAEKDDSKTLFSDTDDDDEDLFGSKTSKASLPKNSQVSNTPKTLMQPIKSIPNTETTADNPLADLLFND